jgi:nicotinamidase-related amidase
VHLAWVAAKKLENLSVSGIEAEVCADIALRQAKGISKYGTTVADNPLALREWVTHLYEELLDASIYCKRILQVMEQDDGK